MACTAQAEGEKSEAEVHVIAHSHCRSRCSAIAMCQDCSGALTIDLLWYMNTRLSSLLHSRVALHAQGNFIELTSDMLLSFSSSSVSKKIILKRR